jgi:hypothetical protein
VPLNLVKLCVGCDTPQDLLDWRASHRARGGSVSVVHTRQTPKRAAELLDGGSLYWVFKGMVLVRQRIDIIETLSEAGRNRCEITLEDVLIPTAPQPRRPFQGWRYLEAKDAPADLPNAEAGEGMPQELARELRELGAW